MIKISAITCSLLLLGIAHADPRVIYVDNTGKAGGNGSYSNPFNTLKEAELASGPWDTIFVSVGDGTTSGMDEGVVLKEGQNLMGSGFPVITNTQGTAVELASYNQVTGVHIMGSKSWAIHGSGINGAFIANTSISEPKKDGGIGIFDGSGPIQITKTTLTGGVKKTVGIHLESTGYTATDALIKWNIINNFDEGVEVYGYKNSSITSEILYNDVSHTSSGGIDIHSFDQSYSTATIENNTIHDNGSNGIIATSESNLKSAISKNWVSGCKMEGIAVYTKNSGRHVASVTNNLFEKNGGQAGFLAETSKSIFQLDTLCLQLNGNESDTGYQLTNHFVDSFYLEVPNTNIGTVQTSGQIKQVGPGYCQ